MLHERKFLFPSESQLIISLIDEIVDFFKRIRWKTFYFCNPGMENKDKSFEFKSLKIPPSYKMLEKFEEDLF